MVSYDIALGTFGKDFNEFAKRETATMFDNFALKGFSSANPDWKTIVLQSIIRAREKGGKILLPGDGVFAPNVGKIDFLNPEKLNELLKGDLYSTQTGRTIWEMKQLVKNKDWYDNTFIVIKEQHKSLKELGIKYTGE